MSWDGFVSFDGVLYGLPRCAPGPTAQPLAGRRVQVHERRGTLTIWHAGQLVLTVAARAHSGTVVPHPEQFDRILPAAAARREHVPVGHQIPVPAVAQRPLTDYDALCGVSSLSSLSRLSSLSSLSSLGSAAAAPWLGAAHEAVAS